MHPCFVDCIGKGWHMKLDRPESARQYKAYTTWRDLGYNRSLREVARRMEASAQTISAWSKKFNWRKRLEEHTGMVAKQKEDGALVTIDDPVMQKMKTMLEQIEAVIDSVFTRDATTDKLRISITIKDPDDLSKMVKEYRQLLETYHKFVSEHKPAGREKEKSMSIKQFNLYTGDISQQERIDIMKGLANGHGLKRNSKSSGGVQEADYTEVSERGDEDGPGRNGVPDSPTDSSSGDETSVRKP